MDLGGPSDAFGAFAYQSGALSQSTIVHINESLGVPEQMAKRRQAVVTQREEARGSLQKLKGGLASWITANKQARCNSRAAAADALLCTAANRHAGFHGQSMREHEQ